MDKWIARMHGTADGDLVRCDQVGMAYQADMTPSVAYDATYFEKFERYDPLIVQRVVQARMDLVARHYSGLVLDVGAGAGHFVAKRPQTFGFDVNPQTVAQLERCGLYSEAFELFEAFTFWDTIEHIADPAVYFDRIPVGSYIFASLPIFSSLAAVRESKHYRPGEHLYYFTARGFIGWMGCYGFRLREVNDAETHAGREGIESFAFYRRSMGAAL